MEEPLAHGFIAQGIAEPLHDDPLAPLLAKSMEGLLANLTTGMNNAIDIALK